jgi:hypothetical protein
VHLGAVSADALEVGVRILVEDLVDLAVVEERVEPARQPIGAAAGAAAGAGAAAATSNYQGCINSGGRIVVKLNSAMQVRVA